MRRFRDWPPRRIAVLWFVGAGMQVLALLVIPPLLGWETEPPEDFAMDTRGPLLARADSTDAMLDTLTAPDLAVTRTVVAPGDTLVRVEMDTSWLQFRTKGGDVQMSPDVEQAATKVGGMLASIIVALGVAVMQVLLLLFTIPAILVAVTLAWLLVRRAPSRG